MPRRPPSLSPDNEPAPQPDDPAPVKHRLGEHREFTAANPTAETGTEDPNDVFAVRRLNLQHEREHSDELLPPVDNSARRRHWRDYAMIMLLGNGLLALGAWLMPGVITAVYAGAGIVVLTLGVTWIYAFVMDPR